MYTDLPIELIREMREELSYQYRKIYGSKKAKDKVNLYWLPIWIDEYDIAIQKITKKARRRDIAKEIDND